MNHGGKRVKVPKDWREGMPVLVLVRERRRRNWSQCEVARRAGIDQPNLSRIERGLMPAYPGWRRRLSRLFRMPADALFTEVSDDGEPGAR